jgi:hypothetical protein
MFRPRLRLLVASCFSLALALVVVAPLSGCDKHGLVETTFPSEGVELRYDHQPGASFEGHIARRETITMRGDSMNRTISFTVVLQVTGVEADGTARVAATVHNIELNWNVPGLPISMNEFNAKAKKMLEGVTIRFAVKPDGTVTDVPATPPDFGDAEAGVLDSVIEGLTAAFFVVPSKRMMAGESWDESDTHGREGKLGKYTVESTRGTLVGMFERKLEDPAGTQTVAKLEIDTDKSETTTTKDGSSEIRTRGTTTVLFDPSGYMAVIDSKQTRIQGATSSTVEFDAKWTRKSTGGGAAATTAPVDKPATQAITDPCDDNYVGPDDCLDPCNSNYMGDEACPDVADPAAGAEPAADPAAAAEPAADPAAEPAPEPAPAP